MSNQIELGRLATARSGDKGNHANIGVVARNAKCFVHLEQHLQAEQIARHFAGLGATQVERFTLPRVGAFNFLLHNVLDGGASLSLRTDTQGKLLGTAILDLLLPAPEDLSILDD
jgi:hypothetical protein